MAPILQGTPAFTVSAVSPYTPTLPDGITSGELLVAHITIVYAATNITTTATGWVRDIFLSDNFGGYVSMAVFHKVAGDSEVAPAFTISSSNTQKQTLTEITRWSGVDGTTPIDDTGARATSQSTSLALPSVTTTKADTTLMGFASGEAEGLALATATFPGTMTELYDAGTTTNLNREIWAGYEARPTAGATGTRTITFSNNNNYLVGAMMALNGGAVPYCTGVLIT